MDSTPDRREFKECNKTASKEGGEKQEGEKRVGGIRYQTIKVNS